MTLEVSSPSIRESGQVANVTASLSWPSSEDVTLIVSVSPVSPAVSGDFTITPSDTLTIAAGRTSSTGALDIAGVDNDVDAPDKSFTVSAKVSGGRGVSAPPSRTLIIADDDGTPTVTLSLSASSISENGGVARVTASLSGPSSEDVTVVVSASPVAPATGGFAISSNRTLTIAAGQISSTGVVTITGVDDSVDAPDKQVIVWATVSGGRGAGTPSSHALTITDDDETSAG